MAKTDMNPSITSTEPIKIAEDIKKNNSESIDSVV
jgi:hypothetical protein